jgi:hypothetical protein
VNNRNIGRILAVLLLGGVLENWCLVPWVSGARDLASLLIGVTWLGLTLAGVIGLVMTRRWGAYCVLLLAPFSTVLLATPLFPGMHLLGLRGPMALAGWNLFALVMAIVVLRSRDVPGRGLAG